MAGYKADYHKLEDGPKDLEFVKCTLRVMGMTCASCVNTIEKHLGKQKGKLYPRKFKGESVAGAILPSRMEVSYCTSGFFVAI